MMRSEDLLALAERCETAPELTGDLLAEICDACGLASKQVGGVTYYDPTRMRLRALAHVLAWESAAVALVERLLPGWDWEVSREKGKAYAGVWPEGKYASLGSDPPKMVATPALALVAACLRALSHQPQEGGNGR